jgi:uncharacterized protein (TIGR02594 family)
MLETAQTKKIFSGTSVTPALQTKQTEVDPHESSPHRQSQLQTARRMGHQFSRVSVSSSSVQLKPATPPTLKQGSSGAAVKDLQEKLNASGAQPPLEVDGDFGPKTKAAVISYQKNHSLDPDGIVGPKTWASLNGGSEQEKPEHNKPGRDQDKPNSDKPKNSNPQTGTGPTWIGIAQAEVGTKEISGSKHNPRIIEYHSTTGKFSDDETPWCASFVNWVMQKAGYQGTNSALALSWQSWGKKLTKPAYGSIAVFSWGGGKGHVGFVVGKSGNNIQVLGGNQSNQVNVTSFGTSQVVAYVVPDNYEVPESAYTLDGSNAGSGAAGNVSNTR